VTPELLLYGFVRNVVVVFSRLFWRMSIEGRDNVPAHGAFVLAPVHRSNVDTLLVAGLTRRRLRYMGKDTLWKIGWIGRIFSALGAFPVRRGTIDREALRRCSEVLAGGEPLVVFPEGTRQSGHQVADLFEGAAYLSLRAGVPIVPVGIGGSEAAMPRGSRLMRPVKVHLVVGAPIAAGPGGIPSRHRVHELTLRLHDELQRLFDEASSRVGVRPGTGGGAPSPDGGRRRRAGRGRRAPGPR
jgi:1-acyl-sn-glycerol-3-phosphate acyltransferase